MSDNKQKVITALENPKYDWRTVDGISKETGLVNEVVLEVLKSLDDQVIRSSVPDKEGNPLFTTRTHYSKTQTLFTRSLSAASGSVKG